VAGVSSLAGQKRQVSLDCGQHWGIRVHEPCSDRRGKTHFGGAWPG